MNTAEIRNKLVHAVTEYDRKQSSKAHYNHYALPQYFARIDEIAKDIDNGAGLREAITAGFTGAVCSACLRAVGLGKATDREWQGGSEWTYKPATANP